MRIEMQFKGCSVLDQALIEEKKDNVITQFKHSKLQQTFSLVALLRFGVEYFLVGGAV
jgi:hypothetical protein